MVAEIVSGLEYSKKVLQDVGEKIAKTREHHPNFHAVLAIVQVCHWPVDKITTWKILVVFEK